MWGGVVLGLGSAIKGVRMWCCTLDRLHIPVVHVCQAVCVPANSCRCHLTTTVPLHRENTRGHRKVTSHFVSRAAPLSSNDDKQTRVRLYSALNICRHSSAPKLHTDVNSPTTLLATDSLLHSAPSSAAAPTPFDAPTLSPGGTPDPAPSLRHLSFHPLWVDICLPLYHFRLKNSFNPRLILSPNLQIKEPLFVLD